MRQYTLHKILGIAVLVFLMVSCEPLPNQGLTKTHDVTGEYLDIRVMTFKSQKSLQKYLTKNKMTFTEVDGLAQWAHPKNDLTKVNRCEIYVVEPKSVKDEDVMGTWGHELAHCIYGSFHK